MALSVAAGPLPVNRQLTNAIRHQKEALPIKKEANSLARKGLVALTASAATSRYYKSCCIARAASQAVETVPRVQSLLGPAPALVQKLWSEVGVAAGISAEKQWLDSFSSDAIIEDLFLADCPRGHAGVRAYLENKSACGRLVIDKCTDGERSCGFTWHWEENGAVGIRGTTFIELDQQGRVSFLREICEPLYKPGDATVELLKAIGGDNVATFDVQAERRKPVGASDICRYLWSELQGNAPPAESVTFFADQVLYEDFNYELPLRRKEEVRDFLEKFAEIKALKFVAERFSDGSKACCFTWNVEIAGAPTDAPRIRGISFYELNDAGKIIYVRDIPESAAKPPPLQALAAMLRPRLRVFFPRSSVVAGEAIHFLMAGMASN
ncbi:Hypothetical protein SCF082_LOCUS33388 [Durusdinium trenchii]|uniref:SnoaL-like domain-containing protein n=2 Tax=Durusdinium trenchii TaxID=1381693 RepID=A0ABP0NNL0_9DINO